MKIKKVEKDQQYPNFLTITYNDGQQISYKFAAKHPLISFAQTPYWWLKQAEDEIINLSSHQEKNINQQIENLRLKNGTITSNQLEILNNEKINNPELNKLICCYIFNKTKLSENDSTYIKKIPNEQEGHVFKQIFNMDNFINYLNLKTNHHAKDIKNVAINNKLCKQNNSSTKFISIISENEKNEETINNIWLIGDLLSGTNYADEIFEIITDQSNSEADVLHGKIIWELTDQLS